MHSCLCNMSQCFTTLLAKLFLMSSLKLKLQFATLNTFILVGGVRCDK